MKPKKIEYVNQAKPNYSKLYNLIDTYTARWVERESIGSSVDHERNGWTFPLRGVGGGSLFRNCFRSRWHDSSP